DVAAATGFKAAIDFEPATVLTSNDERASALSIVLQTHAQHPAYLRMDGKPVIFFWATWAYSVDDWTYIRSLADPDRQSIWIAEGANTEYLAVFDGLHLYNTAWAANPAGIASGWAANTRNAAETYGGFKYWVATAMPGFDDRHLGRGDQAVYRDRAGGAYYQNSFAAAAESSPDLLVITSFNEWAEGSNIEPSVEFGNHYLDLTAQLVSAYKSGAVAAPPPLPDQTEEPVRDEIAQENSAAQNESTPTASTTPLSTTGSPALPTPRSDGAIVYEVQEGDTLSHIASRFDVPLPTLLDYNNLEPDDFLNVGQPLIVGFAEGVSQPQPTASTSLPDGVEAREDGTLVYIVEEDDTLIGIAVRNDLTMEALFAMNEGLTEDSLLSIGQEIIVGQRRQPESSGGSTDFPASEATPTTATTPAGATPTSQAVAPALPSPTVAPPATLQTAAGATESEPPLIEDEIAVTSAPPSGPAESSASTESVPLWLAIAGGFLVLLGLTGGVFFYLGNRRL
ncbi:MAG TPA: LysM peptidoglycan-binding domain-containing protein, partial [Candidatus Sulfomarinibacteraceae bacterium]|nr:LysM peptidoglycan-binding domain-containing protein [Candidatus Sulfomarinibacteraceae bacterium]